MLRVTKAVHDVMSARFEEMLLAGAFPQVKYSNSGGFRSYSLFEYSNVWATYAKVIDEVIKHDMQDTYGIFSRKRNAKFLTYLKRICAEVTEKQVNDTFIRFKSFADNF
jgi:hypothetical protein